MIAGSRAVGPLTISRPVKILAAVSVVGVIAMAYRMVMGLGASTALNDGYPWGLWIAFDVVTGTALACGGYGLALLVYIFNKGEYHPLVRPAILASALGYTLATMSVALDLGRPWLIWKIPLFFWHWNLDSALLEVALCITTYVFVLWMELVPAALDRWRAEPKSRLHALALRWTPKVDRGLGWIIALGILLPTLHQSSLGTLMMLTGPRLHPLWQTWLLPFLFLISCLSMGYAVVVLEGLLSHHMLGRKLETAMLAKLARVIVPLQGLYVVLRVYDLLVRGELSLAFALTPLAALFWVELALFIVPAIMLMKVAYPAPSPIAGAAPSPHQHVVSASLLFRSAALLVAAGALYRLDTFLVAFNPGDHWSYFPSLGEIAITAGLVSMEILAYILIVHYFPILSGAAPATAEKAGAGWPRTLPSTR
jgi:Ni/Fe-hydrogenase subunit HybB-like protein